MNAVTSLGQEDLSIPRQPAPARGAGGRQRTIRWLRVAGVALVLGPAVLVTSLAVGNAVGEKFLKFVALNDLGVTSLAVGNADRESRREQCAVQLKRLGLALNEYNEKHGHFPAPALAGHDRTPLLSWRVALLPYLGYQSLYERFHLDEPWDSPHNRALLAEMPSEFACPSGPGRRQGRTGYLVIVGPVTEFGSVNTPFEPTRGVDIREMIDGTSNTILVLETDALVRWTKPDDLRWAPGGPLPKLASPHAGGTHVLFADGSRRFLKPTIEPNILLGLLTINGGEVLSKA